MEIEKTRETSWKIRLKKDNRFIEITSVEIGGEIRLVKLSLIKEDNSIVVEMNKEEFFNFLSLVEAFKDVIIGEKSFTIEDNSISSELSKTNYEKRSIDETSDIIDSNSSKEVINENDKLNPEEWDPW